jgi:hypothetical protein
MSMVRMVFLAGLFLLASAGRAAEPPTTAPADKMCVALLAPECRASKGQSNPPSAGWLDSLLAESLAGQRDLIAVDRQLLDKVLSEKVLRLADIAKADPDYPKLQPFLTAGILVCPTVYMDDFNKPDVYKLVVVEAVLAQTGQVIAEFGFETGGRGGSVPLSREDNARLNAFWEQVRRGGGDQRRSAG